VDELQPTPTAASRAELLRAASVSRTPTWMIRQLEAAWAREDALRQRFERVLGRATVMMLLGETGPCPHGEPPGSCALCTPELMP
jgi:hypothetical protein